MKAVAALALVALVAGCGNGGARSWHVGTEGAWSWASTVPYRDCRNCVPPHKTLAALPRDGIVIQLATIRKGTRRHYGSWPPKLLARDVHPGFEGVPSRYGVAQLDIRTGRIERGFYVWFGSTHPTVGEIAKANAELLRLSL